MNKSVDVHQVFANYFDDDVIRKLAYECSKCLEEGQICIPFDTFLNNTGLSISENDLLKNQWVGDSESSNVVFILHQHCIYLQRYFAYETDLINTIRAHIAAENISEKQNQLFDIKDFILKLFPTTKSKTDWQLVASLNAYLHHFSLITGGPGTGKTTTIAKLLSVVFTINPNAKIALIAPTGKASARMKESLMNSKEHLNLPKHIQDGFDNIENSTIHRLLGAKRETHYFKHHKDQPLNYDWIIIDESSMMGISLFSKLLEAVSKSCQLVLLGDKHQLSSVEAGSVFGDICNSLGNGINSFSKPEVDFFKHFAQDVPLLKAMTPNIMQGRIIELRQNYRFSEDSSIGQFSRAILSGELDIEQFTSLQNNEIQIFQDFEIDNIEQFFIHFKDYIQSKTPLEALKKYRDFRILCPTHVGKMGVDNINRSVETFLRSKQLISKYPNTPFYEHQAILIRSNDYHLQLFNGDIGIIRKDKNGQLMAYFESEDGGLRSVNPYLLDVYETAYAMSIHKSQGSEFKHIVVVLPENTPTHLLNKELVYTAVTRAKQQLSLFASASILDKACKRSLKKATGISERLS